MLIVARALLGLAGATLAPSTMSLIFTMFRDPQQRTVAIGVWIASYSAGAAVGPLLGGVMLEFFWWGSVFLLGVPVMVLLLAVGPRLLPESRDEDAGRLDLPSAALSLAAVLLVVYGLKTAAQDGFAGDAMAAIVLGAGGRGAVRPPPAAAAEPADRPRAVPAAGVQRLAAHEHARLLRRVRRVLLRRPVPADRRSGSRRSRRACGRCRRRRASSSARWSGRCC